MVRRKLETQTHIRIFNSDKRKIETIMRKGKINSQAMAIRLLLKNAIKKK